MNTSLLLRAFPSFVLLIGAAACKPAPKKDDPPPTPKVTDTATPAPTTGAQVAAIRADVAATGADVAAAGIVNGTMPRLGPAPEWQLKDLAGKVVNSEQFKGKVVVVDFWATWCGPCREEIPGYIALQNKYGKDGLVIIGVSIDQGGPGVVKSFATKFGVNYTLVMADETIAAAFGGVDVIPTTFLIDRTGQIRNRKEGSEETADYEKKIAAVIGEKT